MAKFKPGDEWTGNRAGRPKGSTTRNRRDQQIEELCEKHGFQPIEWHIIVASKGRYPTCEPGKPMKVSKQGGVYADQAYRHMSARIVADKIYPNLKAIEFEQDTNFTVTIRDVANEGRPEQAKPRTARKAVKKKAAKKKAKKK